MRHTLFMTALTGIFILGACGPKSDHAPFPTHTPEAERSGDWSLSPEGSQLNYLTFKNGDIAEVNSFGVLDGSVTEAGEAILTVYLDSVDTRNEIRDPRMKEHLFKTDQFPVATVKTRIDMDALTPMQTGARKTLETDIAIHLHGKDVDQDFEMTVTRLGPNKVLVENKEPLILEAYDFDLEASIETLRELAGLESITPTVPVTFSLVFER